MVKIPDSMVPLEKNVMGRSIGKKRIRKRLSSKKKVTLQMVDGTNQEAILNNEVGLLFIN
jgi:hypothetical protein